MSEEPEREWPENDIFEQDRADAAATLCPRCGVAFEVVRPGKIQPSCPCAYIEELEAERDQSVTEINRLKAERDELQGIVDAYGSREEWASQMKKARHDVLVECASLCELPFHLAANHEYRQGRLSCYHAITKLITDPAQP